MPKTKTTPCPSCHNKTRLTPCPVCNSKTTPHSEYDRDYPMDNLSPKTLGVLADICVQLEKADRTFSNINFVKLRSLIYSEDIQNWLIDLERLAFIRTRNL